MMRVRTWWTVLGAGAVAVLLWSWKLGGAFSGASSSEVDDYPERAPRREAPESARLEGAVPGTGEADLKAPPHRTTKGKPKRRLALDPARAARIRHFMDGLRGAGETDDIQQRSRTVPRMAANGKALADYLTRVMQDQYMPLFQLCKERLQEQSSNARGELVLDTSLSGAAEVGGVVESVSVREGATLDNEEFVLCVEQSLYALVLDAPPEDNMSLPLTMNVRVAPPGEGSPPFKETDGLPDVAGVAANRGVMP